MARWILCSFLVVGSVEQLLAASITPDAFYDAEIKGTNLFAYSGPGANFYPTSMLRTGQLVTVAGPAKEGWLPILPPTESFSWIPADRVKENRDGSGIVLQDATRVFLGSTLSDARQVHQVVLAKGDVVQIIDEQILTDRGASGRWFKILPPSSERRYIAAEAIQGSASPSLPTTGGSNLPSSPVNPAIPATTLPLPLASASEFSRRARSCSDRASAGPAIPPAHRHADLDFLAPQDDFLR